MNEWFRRKTWTEKDETEFFVKLKRARKDGRAQYLKIQAIELIRTKGKRQLQAAEILLNKILTEYPDDKLNKSQTLNSLGEIYASYKNYDKAIEYFNQALNFEKEFPNVKTTAYLNFSETVVRTERYDLYSEVENILTLELKENGIFFPIQKYIAFSVLSVIYEYKGDRLKSEFYSNLAEENATAQTNELWNPRKRKYGVVNERKKWLDKLIKKNLNNPQNTKKVTHTS
ncbi:hypothetical protein FORMB_20850 [Formosa sp. Hel1_33_131]|uniref:tetratricopeptide repeat protein n=1 Tax=Formosa sp. Hel1_33_131 TaxID=1336794 RepID=UPI00084E1423|nr:tetratricopeptide repeat protein [Formosa sp. Hel1_33_131]AOR29113.1 hypothetical protein FORMB_20850 [Formosa sp. Hel1_33_131]